MHYGIPNILEEIPLPMAIPISNRATTDVHGFDTFGDSDSTNKKITAVSELQSPDRTNSPSHATLPLIKQQIKDLKAYEDSEEIVARPYGNKHPNGQEFHYSGSFGVPGTFQAGASL
jgi:hypothetical protein